MKIEIGSGEHPAPGFDVRVDVLMLPGVTHHAHMDALPFPDGTFDELRANDVLEHQSWEKTIPTLKEWARVLKSGATAYIQVPNARLLAERWLAGTLSTERANYWILGGHTDRPSHQGVDAFGVPKWIWNAHHTLFDPEYLRHCLEQAGFGNIRVQSDGGSNLCCWAMRG
jgi:predicted SAM-dependent methyltransferase